MIQVLISVILQSNLYPGAEYPLGRIAPTVSTHFGIPQLNPTESQYIGSDNIHSEGLNFKPVQQVCRQRISYFGRLQPEERTVLHKPGTVLEVIRYRLFRQTGP